MFTTSSKRLAASFLAVVSIASAQPVMADALSSLFSFSIVEVDENGEEKLVERSSVSPGETIQYSLVHKNTSEDNLSGLGLGVPIPEGVTLVTGTETSSVDALFEVQAELEPENEGLEWATWPAERKIIEADGSVRTEPLPADAVEAVRWTLSDALPSGETAMNSYRVVVN